MEQATDFLWKFLELLLTLTLPILAGYAAAWLKKKYEVLKLKLEPDVYWLLTQATELAVLAAEQTKFDPAEKLQEAVNFVQIFLDAQGVDLDMDVIIGAVEAEVMKRFNLEREAGREG